MKAGFLVTVRSDLDYEKVEKVLVVLMNILEKTVDGKVGLKRAWEDAQ